MVLLDVDRASGGFDMLTNFHSLSLRQDTSCCEEYYFIDYIPLNSVDSDKNY